MLQFVKKTTLVGSFLLCIAISQVFSQGVKWGKLQTSPSHLYTPHIMGDDADFIYSTTTVGEEIFIEKFKKSDLSRLYSKLIDRPKIAKKELEYEGIYFMKNKFVIFASYFNTSENTTSIYAYSYNAENGQKAGEPKNILTVPVEKLKRKGNFYVFVSKDRTKILVNHAGYYKKEKCVKDKYLLLNEELDIITEKEEKIFKDEIDYTTFNYIIDNEGSFYYIKTMNTHESFIVSYDANKDFEKWEEHIDFSDLNRKTRIIKLRFAINSDNDLMLVGYYTLDDKNLEGTFVMKIRTASKEIVFKKINTFDKETLKKLALSNTLLSNKNALKIPIEQYNSTEISTKSDGGIILISEYVLIYTNGLYELRDIIILNHSSEGELMWTQKIPKYQHYAVTAMFKPLDKALKLAEYISFLSTIQNGKLNIYLNDYKGNAAISKEELLKSNKARVCNLKKMKKTLPLCYSYDLQTGEMQKTQMLPVNKEKVYFKPSISYQKQYNSDVIIFSQFKKNYKLGIIPN